MGFKKIISRTIGWPVKRLLDDTYNKRMQSITGSTGTRKDIFRDIGKIIKKKFKQ